MSLIEGITEERDKLYAPGIAGGSIEPYRIVVYGTDPDEIIQCTLTSQFPAGISGDASENGKSSYEENDPIEVKYSGFVYLEMYSTGSKGDRIISHTDGRGTKHTFGTNCWIIGVAMADWVEGDIILVELLRFYMPSS
jgi:hypothetical protein